MKKYYPRIADEQLKFKLQACGAVIIKGPKWCGKSTTAEQIAKSAVYLQDQETSEQNIALAKNAPSLFLKGKTPRLIDEWQIAPFIWDQVRFEVDHRNQNGQFILTGSATPLDDLKGQSYRHSGIGRITPLIMRPMALYESEDGIGSVSLNQLFENKKIQPSECSLNIEDYAYLTCRGGWPHCLGLSKKVALEQAYVFYDGLVHDDINRVFKNAKNPARIARLLRSYARGIASEMSISEIKRDMKNLEGMQIDESTIDSYINALRRLYVVEELESWNPNLRSKTAIRTSPTRHFVDPSIACAALGLGPGDLIADMNTYGLLFESMCIRDLRIFAEKINGTVFHYRDKKGREADAIVHLRDGRWAAVEVKLTSQESIEEGAKHLKSIADDIDKTKMKAPSFLMVITATNFAYRREDGVFVVPAGCLKD